MTGDNPQETSKPAALGNLQRELRALRRRSGVTARQLSQRSSYSPSALSRAEVGGFRPSWEIVQEFVTRLGGDPNDFRELWNQAASTAAEDESPAALVAESDTRSAASQRAGSFYREVFQSSSNTTSKSDQRVPSIADFDKTGSLQQMDFQGNSRRSVTTVAALASIGVAIALATLALTSMESQLPLARTIASIGAATIGVLTLGYSSFAFKQRAQNIALATSISSDLNKIGILAIDRALSNPLNAYELISYLETARSLRYHLTVSRDYVEAKLLDEAIESLLKRIDPSIQSTQPDDSSEADRQTDSAVQ